MDIIFKHLVSVDDLTIEDLDYVFFLSDLIKKNSKKFNNSLKNKIILTFFFEPSTRTRLSFESAILRLGGKVLSTENALENSSGKKGESIEDTIKILQSYSDAIILRHPDEYSSYKASIISKIPIINAGSGKGEHPTQAILDLYTIYTYKNKIDNISIAIIGDLLYGRAVHSLIKILRFYKNIKIYFLSDSKIDLDEKYVFFINKNNIKYKKCINFEEIPKDIDIIYQTRLQKERYDKNLSCEFKKFVLNKKIMQNFSYDTLIMHPLPRLDEISEDLNDDHRSIFFDQAKNGLYVRMALLHILCGNI